MSDERPRWGLWGDDDERGAFNLVTPAVTLAALREVRTGQVVPLAQPMGPGTTVAAHRRPVARFMERDAGDYALGARAPGGFKFAEDVVQFATHSGTHLDALAHVWSGDKLYNGHPAAGIRSTTGAQHLGAEHLMPVLTRGVLLDVAALRGAPLAASSTIEHHELAIAYDRAGTEPREGDAVLIRTGWWESASTETYYADEPGISGDAAAWLVDAGAAVVGADNYAIEVQPALGGVGFPGHLALIHVGGVPILENLDLSGLAETGRTVFLFVLCPLPLQGSTASPVQPVAVL